MKKTTVLFMLLSNIFTFQFFASAQQSSPCLDLNHNLKKGYIDYDNVLSLQHFLYNRGFLNVVPTGFFGNATFLAVKDFQSENNINQTGIVGSLTRKKIRDITCNYTPSTQTNYEATNRPIICSYPAPPQDCSYVPGPAYIRYTQCGMILSCTVSASSTKETTRNSLPDLTSGDTIVTKLSDMVSGAIDVKYKSTVSNIGANLSNFDANIGFDVYFQIIDKRFVNNFKGYVIPVKQKNLNSGESRDVIAEAKSPYQLINGNYKVRLCADESPVTASFNNEVYPNVIYEIDESNNCGVWTNFQVTEQGNIVTQVNAIIATSTVIINTDAVLPKINTFAASPASITGSGSTRIYFTSSNASRCSITSPNISIALPSSIPSTSGAFYTTKLNQDTTFTLSCSSVYGSSISKDLTVKVLSDSILISTATDKVIQPMPITIVPIVIPATSTVVQTTNITPAVPTCDTQSGYFVGYFASGNSCMKYCPNGSYVIQPNTCNIIVPICKSGEILIVAGNVCVPDIGTGRLSGENCIINIGESKCITNVTFKLSGAQGGKVDMVTDPFTSEKIVHYSSNYENNIFKTVPVTLKYSTENSGERLVYLYVNDAKLSQLPLKAVCSPDSTWNGNICYSNDTVNKPTTAGITANSPVVGLNSSFFITWFANIIIGNSGIMNYYLLIDGNEINKRSDQFYSGTAAGFGLSVGNHSLSSKACNQAGCTEWSPNVYVNVGF